MIHLMYYIRVCYVLYSSYSIINTVFVNGFTIRITNTNRTLDLSKFSIDCSKTDPLSSGSQEDEYNIPSSIFEKVSKREDIPEYKEIFDFKKITTTPLKPKIVNILALSDCIELCEKFRIHYHDGIIPSYENLLKLEKNMSQGQKYENWTLEGVKECKNLMKKHDTEIKYVAECFMDNTVLRSNVAKALFLGICRATNMMVKTDKKNMYELSYENVIRRAKEIIPGGHDYYKRNKKKMEYCFKSLGDQTQYPPEEIALHFMQCLVLQ